MIKKLFTNRWFLVGLGFLFFSILVWFIGPLFGFADSRPLASVSARLYFILAGLLLFAAYQLYKFIQARRASKKLMEGMVDQSSVASNANAAAEVEMLRARVKQAIDTLRKQGGGRKWGQEYLYQIPWYMFIGAPGSGKTTALVNCGLRFPVSVGQHAQAVKGVGGTRNCDWWFTDDAVFLDTAGRYTTQDSDKKADSTAWLGFLDVLKKFRSRHPLNGAIVTVSISDLLTQSEKERDNYAFAVRQRIEELRQHLNVDFPVYLMVTKADLLAGFSEFFSNLGAEERSQVLGVTFPYSETNSDGFDLSNAFLTQFKEIENRLNARVIDRLQNERDLHRRAIIYSFTQQFSAVGPMLARFVELVFGKSRFEHKILLRGIYFTSGTQEGTPIDRVLGSLSRFLKVERMISPPLVSSGKSFFLTKLLKETIFPESGLVGFDAKREKRRKFILAGTYVSILLIAVVVIVAWVLSYYKNETLIKEVQGRTATLAQISVNLPQPASDDWNSVLPFLNQLRDIPYGHAEREKSVPLNFRFGLFQGDRIGDLADETYLRALRTVFLPRVALFLENQISSASQNEVKYEALKAYLMLFDDKHLDKEALIGFLSADWEHVMQESGITDHNEDFTSHLRASLENHPVSISWSRDDVLIASARLSLASSSLAERILSRLRIVGVSQSTQSVKLSDMMGSAGTQIFERVGGEPLSTPLPSIFTKSEYRDGFSQAASKVVEQMADEDIWVLGENNSSSQKEANKAELLDVVKRQYLEEYIRNWDEILGSIRLKNSASLNDTLTYARILSAADSPLKKLLVGVSKEVTLSAGDTPAVSEKVTDKVYEGAKEMAAKLLGGTPSMTRVQVKNKLPETVVDDHFEPLRQLLTASGPGQPMPIDQTLGLLNDFYQELSSFANGGQGATEIKPLSSAIRLKSEAERLPSPLGKIIKDLVTVTLGQTVAANRANIQKAIGGASSFCDKAISGRYPVSTSSSKDIMVADFNSVFSPGGEIDNFFNLNLKQVVDTSGAMWKLRDGAEATSPVSSNALHQFQNADSIRRTFFRGGSTAAVTADLRLVSSELPQVTLEYNGEAHQFSASGTSAWTLRWPAQNSAGAKLFASSAALGINTEGDWAIFRLIDKSRIESSSPERLRLAFLLEGKRVVFELRSNSVLNPFRLRELGAFKCPGRN